VTNDMLHEAGDDACLVLVVLVLPSLFRHLSTIEASADAQRARALFFVGIVFTWTAVMAQLVF